MSNYYNKTISLLRKLKGLQPKVRMGAHLSTAFDGMDLWSATDKELFEALDVYTEKYEFDVPHDDSELEKIIQDGMHLSIDNGEDD